MRRTRRLRAWVASAIVFSSVPWVPAAAGVQVIVGPTPIVNGDAKADRDITVVNENLAFALAVQSAVPYGVPRGALIDLAPVMDGKIGRDRVVFADFIPNHWSAWPNTYHRVEIVEQGPDRANIRTTRDWGKVTIVTVYTLASKSDHIEIRTTMTNGGGVALPGLLSGLTLWPNSGFLFGVPGMQGVAEGKATSALADRVVAYDENWAIALHASYFDHVGEQDHHQGEAGLDPDPQLRGLRVPGRIPTAKESSIGSLRRAIMDSPCRREADSWGRAGRSRWWFRPVGTRSNTLH